MGAEDFSLYLESEGGVPGAFFFVGGKKDENSLSYAHHTSTFNATDENMPYVISLWIALAQDRFNINLYTYPDQN